MLVERRLALASRGLIRAGARRNYSIKVADLDTDKRGIPIPSMPTGEEFLKAKAAIKEHAVRESHDILWIFDVIVLTLWDALQTPRPSGVESGQNRQRASPVILVANTIPTGFNSLFACVPVSAYEFIESHHSSL